MLSHRESQNVLHGHSDLVLHGHLHGHCPTWPLRAVLHGHYFRDMALDHLLVKLNQASTTSRSHFQHQRMRQIQPELKCQQGRALSNVRYGSTVPFTVGMVPKMTIRAICKIVKLPAVVHLEAGSVLWLRFCQLSLNLLLEDAAGSARKSELPGEPNLTPNEGHGNEDEVPRGKGTDRRRMSGCRGNRSEKCQTAARSYTAFQSNATALQ